MPVERFPLILETKLYFPPVRPVVVPRPHLVERLQSGVSGVLTLLSAPAGYGKTTLLGEWRNGPGKNVAVDRLDEYAVNQGRVTDEENDIIVVQQTERGYAMLARHTSHDWISDVCPTDLTEALVAELPGVPTELFYCLDLSKFCGD